MPWTIGAVVSPLRYGREMIYDIAAMSVVISQERECRKRMEDLYETSLVRTTGCTGAYTGHDI